MTGAAGTAWPSTSTRGGRALAPALGGREPGARDHRHPPLKKVADRFQWSLRTAGITRAELFTDDDRTKRLTMHDLRASMLVVLPRFLALPLLLAALPLALACESRSPAPAAPTPSARIEALSLDEVTGLSGLAADDKGSLWSVPEDRPLLLEIPQSGAPRSLPLRGVPEGLERESLAWIAGDRFAAGTEGGCKSGAERILVILREGGEARVERTLDLPLALLGSSCDEHHGIEGLCSAGGKLVAAVEQTIDKGGARLAPLARVDPQSGEATAYRLALTSDTGKISALDCRARGEVIEVLAIERHFEVSRLLTFSVPASGPTQDAPLRPRVVAELGALTNGGKRNFEGVVWLDDRRAMLVVDNDYRGVTGPNEILHLELPAP